MLRRGGETDAGTHIQVGQADYFPRHRVLPHSTRKRRLGPDRTGSVYGGLDRCSKDLWSKFSSGQEGRGGEGVRRGRSVGIGDVSKSRRGGGGDKFGRAGKFGRG